MPACVLLVAVLSLLSIASPQPVQGGGAAASQKREFLQELLRFERGPQLRPLWIPRAEELKYKVFVDLPVLGETAAGRVTLSAGVDPYIAGLAAPGKGEKSAPQWTGWVKSVATGSALGYELQHELKSRLLPQEWPAIYYTDTQRGSETRNRELKLGVLDSGWSGWYRNDGHCKDCDNKEHFVDSAWLWAKPSHCTERKCRNLGHRLWREPQKRSVPAGTTDMLSAVYYARALVREKRSEDSILILDKQRLWQVHLSVGGTKTVEVPGGKVECVEVRLRSAVPEGEPPSKENFQGLFGLQGAIRIWLDRQYGVPVRIEGEFPITLLSTELDVSVQLEQYSGTPTGFALR